MSACEADAAIIGGGPVGLLLACLLGRDGRRVALLEAHTEPPARSMAIGITPPSLDILESLALDKPFLEKGVRVEQAVVHESGRTVGRLPLSLLPPPFNFILTLPQSDTVRLLRESLHAFPHVTFHAGWSATRLEQDGEGVRIHAVSETRGRDLALSAPLAAACDGTYGHVRRWVDMPMRRHVYAPVFRMADYADASGLGAEAHLFFGPERPVESFPLPGRRRRWILRCGLRHRMDLDTTAESAIRRLTGITLDPAAACNESEFQPRYGLARRLWKGRVALCGDAAHVMSPIGGQGMNTGWGDAAHLARAFGAILDGAATPEAALSDYSRRRRRAFRTAARRSAMGMRLGVARGPTASRLRGVLVAGLLGGSATSRFMARWFAMRSLPHPIEGIRAI